MPDRTSATIDIAAPPEAVMAVIADFGAYPSWVDAITRADVLTTEDGRPRTVRMRLEHAVVSDTYVLAYNWAPTAVDWHLVEGSLLTAMDGSYDLADQGTSTRVTYNLRVDLTVPMIGLFKRKAEKTIIDGALRGLKKRVEG